MSLPLKSPAELASRLDLAAGDRLLLIDPPESLRELAESMRIGKEETRTVEGDRIRKVKDSFDGILLWREDRVGSQSLLEAAAKRLGPGGFVWIIVAMRKVTGVAVPGAHRLGLEDLVRAFPPGGWVHDRETRVSAWHIAHRFVRKI